MIKKPYKLLVVDDIQKFLEAICPIIQEGFSDRPVEVIGIPAEGISDPLAYAKLLNSMNPDGIVMDHFLGDLRGIDVADNLVRLRDKRRQRHIQIFSMSAGFDPEDPHCVGVEYDFWEALQEGTIKGCWNKRNIQDLTGLIKKKMSKPLEAVGIYGMGEMGIGLASRLKDSELVSKVYIGSQRTKLEPVLDLLERDPKVEKTESLEDLLDKVQILVLTTSHLKGKKIPELVKSYDRREIFRHEAPKFKRIFTTIKNNRFDNPVVIVSNPVAHLYEYARRLGLDPSMLYSALEPGVTRIDRSLFICFYEYLSKLDKDERKPYDENIDLYLDFLHEAHKYVVGVHGHYRLIVPDSYKPLIKEQDMEWIRKAEKESKKIAFRSQKAAIELKKPFNEPQQLNVNFFEQMARYQQMPYSCHCFYAAGEYHGFIAIPISIALKDQIARKDEARIEEIGKREIDMFATMILGDQQSYLNDFMTQAN